jgi:hypothetical protein
MGNGLLAEWRRGIFARGMAGAALVAVPVAVAAAIGFGTSLNGLTGGLSELASGPGDSAAPAPAAPAGDTIDDAIVDLSGPPSGAGAGEGTGGGGGGGGDGDGGGDGGSVVQTPGGGGGGGGDGGGGGVAGQPTGDAVPELPPLPGGSDGGGGGTGGAGGGVGGVVNEVLDGVGIGGGGVLP